MTSRERVLTALEHKEADRVPVDLGAMLSTGIMGIDILNPVQVSAKDMDTKKLKDEFGKEITFWGGGCDTYNNSGYPYWFYLKSMAKRTEKTSTFKEVKNGN